MKIEKIIIENYKSIKHMEIPMSNDYGESDAVFLLGINESGKSNILEAIYQLKNLFSGMEYHNVCYATSQEKSKEVRIAAVARLDAEEYSDCIDVISDKIPALRENVNKIAKIQITRSIFFRREHNHVSVTEAETDVIFDNDFPFDEYVYLEDDTVVFADSDEALKSFETSQVTSKILELIIRDRISEIFSNVLQPKFPEILYWKSAEQYLIADAINLMEYQETPSLSIPLTNMFLLSKEGDIRNAIEVALSSDGQKAGLEEKLSDATTDHINEVWKDHQVNIKAKIHAESMIILVEDKEEKYTFLNVQQRSDGFKQFISLLLTLSAEYQEGMLKNTILLLDEPEAHLHPSGVRLMRDEIFKMARNNKIFVATHSPSMIDIETPHRHWVVKKTADKEGKLQTEIHHVDKDMSMKDEEVLQQAFGINVMKEILPDNLLLVEGKTDKKLLQFALNSLKERGNIPFIITSADGSNMPKLANIIDFHDINAVIFLDADGAGKSMQEKIIENRSSFDEGNVFTLDNFFDDLPDGATIEDLIPEGCIKKCLEDNGKKYNPNTIRDGKKVRILARIASDNRDLRGQENKREMDKIKLKLAEQAIHEYPLDKEKEYARLFELAEKLLEKMRAQRRS